MLSAIWANGNTEPLIFEGALNRSIFELYIEKCLLPHIKAGDIVVMDNLSSHKSEKVQSLIESKDATLMYLPPYSPDLNPIEEMWSKIKSIIRKISTNSLDELEKAIAFAFDKITPKDAAGWFKNSGYRS